MKEQKNYVDELIKNSILYYNRDSYRMLSKKERTVVFYTLRKLVKIKTITKGDLFRSVSLDFNSYVKNKIVDYYKKDKKNYVDNIIGNKDNKWLIRKCPKTKKQLKSLLNSRHFGRIIDYLNPLLVNLKTTGCSNPGQAHIISINHRGRKLWKGWLEYIKSKKNKTKGE